MSLLSDVAVIFLSSILVLIPDWQFFGCTTVEFSEQYNVSFLGFFPFLKIPVLSNLSLTKFSEAILSLGFILESSVMDVH